MARSNDLAGLLKKAQFNLSLADVVTFGQVLDWLTELGKDMVETYKKEAEADVVEGKKPEDEAGFKITSWNPTGAKEIVKKKK